MGAQGSAGALPGNSRSVSPRPVRYRPRATLGEGTGVARAESSDAESDAGAAIAGAAWHDRVPPQGGGAAQQGGALEMTAAQEWQLSRLQELQALQQAVALDFVNLEV